MTDPAVREAPGYNRLAALDGVRAIALCSVLWYHVWLVTWLGAYGTFFGISINLDQYPATGALGVDIFFFVSGFCLFYPYAQTLFDGRPLQTLGDFAWRRFIKIVPSYVLFMLVLVAFGMASQVHNAGEAVRAIAIHLTFMHTWFPESYGSIAGVLWSLGVEVQFYIMFPPICWAAMRRPAIVFPAMFAIALVYRVIVAQDMDMIEYRISSVFGVLDLFGAGMLAAYLYRFIPKYADRVAGKKLAWTALSLLGFAGLLWAFNDCWAWRDLPAWQSVWRIEHRTLFAGLLALATLAALFAFPIWQRILGNPLFVFTSTISYNLYLWHQVVSLQLARFHIPNYTTVDPHDDPHWPLLAFAIDVLVSVAVASLITFLFERPLLRLRPEHFRRVRFFRTRRAL